MVVPNYEDSIDGLLEALEIRDKETLPLDLACTPRTGLSSLNTPYQLRFEYGQLGIFFEHFPIDTDRLQTMVLSGNYMYVPLLTDVPNRYGPLMVTKNPNYDSSFMSERKAS